MCWCAFLMPMPGRAFTKSQPAKMHICHSGPHLHSAAGSEHTHQVAWTRRSTTSTLDDLWITSRNI